MVYFKLKECAGKTYFFSYISVFRSGKVSSPKSIGDGTILGREMILIIFDGNEDSNYNETLSFDGH